MNRDQLVQSLATAARDIGRIVVAPALRYSAVSRDARGEALSATVLMLKGANGREVVGRVLQRIEEIKPLLPKGVRIVPFYNQGSCWRPQHRLRSGR